MPSDEIIKELKIGPATQGLLDGLDPALDDQFFAPTFASDLENIRVGKGLWETRLGMSLFKTLPGTGDVRLLTSFYKANGSRFRLAAQGTGASAILYDYEVGVDSSFQTTSGGTGLGGTTQPYFQGAVLNDYYYFLDRAGALRKYTPDPSAGNQVITVVQPGAPAAAPVVRSRPYAYLDSWNQNSGTTPFGWTVSSSADYDITDATSTKPNPQGGRTVKLAIKTGSATGATIGDDIAGQVVNSNTIAYWTQQSRNRFHQNFQVGLNSAGDLLTQATRNPSQDEWTPVFINTGGIATINYKRFIVVNPIVSNDYISRLVLPGRLNGQYVWVYTHYNPTTGAESAPSAISNGGTPVDLSAIGKTGDTSTIGAFNKSAAITFTSDSGTDATTTKIRIYRSGGTPKLAVDSNGRQVWYRVGEVFDQSTTLSSSPSLGAVTFTVTAATNLAVGDTLVLDKGNTNEETVTISIIASTTITITEPLVSAHVSGHSVQLAFLDNVANEAVDTTTPIQIERDNAPSAGKWIARSPDGRLWIFNYSGSPTGVAVSNRATPDHPIDYEVFPNGVDPLTRRDLLQGWRFEIGGDTTDEEIMWGGIYGGLPTAITRRHVYQIQAYSQADWGPNAIQKVLNVGCICGDTVQECNGVLYWVADGPRVMRWDGRSAPQCVSHERVNTTLNNAPTAYWNQWFAVYHAKRDGDYYCLYMAPSGATTNTTRLDYMIENGAWEPVVYYNSGGTALAWRGAVALDGATDVRELYQVSTTGAVEQAETGLTDDGVAIKIRLATKKFYLDGYTALMHTFFLRLSAVTDALTLTVTTGGSEYGDMSSSYTLTTTGSGDLEIYRRLLRTLKGRWVKIGISGDVSNRPAIRDMIVRLLPLRGSRYKRT